jgi:hypothetical protein
MKVLLNILLLLLLSLKLQAASVTFTAKSSHDVVEVGQRFQVTFTINGGGGNFTPPDFGSFRLLSGPNQSSSMQYINGQMSRSFSISYVLMATKEGEFTIGEARMQVEDKNLTTDPFQIKVVAASQNSRNAHKQRQNQRKNEGEQLSDYVYLRATVDKRKAYVGEKISVNYKLYSRLTLNGIDLEKLPALTGFWSQDLSSIYDEVKVSTEYIDGEVYQVANLQQSVLYPQRSGKLTIDPLEMLVTVQVRSRQTRSIFESMFGSYERKEVIAKSQPITIEVEPLPGLATGEFSGAVGNFDLDVSVNKEKVNANEAINLKIKISGNGNLPLIGAPELNFPPDFEVYDPETENNFQTTAHGSSGSKTFNYLIIPRHSGEFTLDPYSFTYFDLNSKQYKTLRSPPLTIQVEKGAREENVVYEGNTRKEEVAVLGSDIRFIHLNNLNLTPIDEHFYGSTAFYLLLLSSLLLTLGLYLYARHRKDRLSDREGLRRSKANKLAKKRLSKAKKHLDQKETRLFYEEISAALYGYYADKYNIPLAALSQDKIMELLREDDAHEEMIAELKDIFEDAEMARFAPSSKTNPTTLYQRAAAIISKTENLKS